MVRQFHSGYIRARICTFSSPASRRYVNELHRLLNFPLLFLVYQETILQLQVLIPLHLERGKVQQQLVQLKVRRSCCKSAKQHLSLFALCTPSTYLTKLHVFILPSLQSQPWGRRWERSHWPAFANPVKVRLSVLKVEPQEEDMLKLVGTRFNNIRTIFG